MDKLSKDNKPIKTPEIKPELSFEEGVIASIKRIKEILQNKQIVVVAFSSSSTNVGKTHLSQRIMNELFKDEILSYTLHTIGDISNPDAKAQFIETTSNFNGKRVLIIDQHTWGVISNSKREFYKAAQDKKLKDILLGTKFETDKIDLWVGISTLNKPFNSDDKYSPVADILVKNEFARSKIISIKS